MGACECSVANRIAAGVPKSQVLNAYYARDQKVTAAEVVSATQVLAQGAQCLPKGAWFLYSKQDVYALGIQNIKPIALYVRTKTFQTWVYERNFRNRKK